VNDAQAIAVARILAYSLLRHIEGQTPCPPVCAVHELRPLGPESDSRRQPREETHDPKQISG